MSNLRNSFSDNDLVKIKATAREAYLPVVWTEKKALAHFREKITPEMVDSIVSELLAYREAQGNVVGWKWRLVDMASSETSAWRICLLPHSPGGGAGFETESIPLYAAPPLPVVPKEITSASAPEVFEIAAEAERLGLRGTYASYAVGWNACISAMLAAAPKPEEK